MRWAFPPPPLNSNTSFPRAEIEIMFLRGQKNEWSNFHTCIVNSPMVDLFMYIWPATIKQIYILNISWRLWNGKAQKGLIANGRRSVFIVIAKNCWTIPQNGVYRFLTVFFFQDHIFKRHGKGKTMENLQGNLNPDQNDSL